MCFQQGFVLVLTAFRRFWYKYICFDPNCRMVVVASIQMLLARRFFGYSIFSSLLLLRPFIFHYWNMQSRRNQLLCATSEHDYKLQHYIEMWPCRARTPSCHYQAIFTEYADSMTFAWILDVSQLKKRVKQKFSPWIFLPVIAKYVRPYFQLLVNKELI